MAKFYGEVGFAIPEQSHGVCADKIVRRNYYGDMLKVYSRVRNSGQVNDNLVLNHIIEIISDPFAMNHYSSIRYVKSMGVRWKVDSVEVAYPRLKLTLGEVYNGEQTEAAR